MAKLYKIKTTASPSIGFPFPDLGIYINQELYDELDSIDSAFNGICADLNTFGMASHWDL